MDYQRINTLIENLRYGPGDDPEIVNDLMQDAASALEDYVSDYAQFIDREP